MSASMIEAESDTCALLMVLMMLNLPAVSSFGSCAMAGKAGSCTPCALPTGVVPGSTTLAPALAALGCTLLPRTRPVPSVSNEGLVLCKARAPPCLHLRMATTERSGGGSFPEHVVGRVANVWVLAEKDGPPDAAHVRICADVIEALKTEGGEGQISALSAIDGSPVAVELTSSRGQHRPFRFPGAAGPVTQVRETSFGGSGLGYAVWDAGVGLGIWLAMNSAKVEGRRVLELGSGVGIGGITAALVGAQSVVLTDFGQSNDTSVACSSSRSESLLASDVETASLEGPESALSSALVHVAAGDASDAVRLSAGEEKDRGAKNSVVEKQLQPSKLLGNLDYTTQLNGVEEVSRHVEHNVCGVYWALGRVTPCTLSRRLCVSMCACAQLGSFSCVFTPVRMLKHAAESDPATGLARMSIAWVCGRGAVRGGYWERRDLL